jgi:hypothetical protein
MGTARISGIDAGAMKAAGCGQSIAAVPQG